MVYSSRMVMVVGAPPCKDAARGMRMRDLREDGHFDMRVCWSVDEGPATVHGVSHILPVRGQVSGGRPVCLSSHGRAVLL